MICGSWFLIGFLVLIRFGLNYVPKSVSSTLYPAGAGYFSSHVGGGGGGGGVGFDPSVLVMKINFLFSELVIIEILYNWFIIDLNV